MTLHRYLVRRTKRLLRGTPLIVKIKPKAGSRPQLTKTSFCLQSPVCIIYIPIIPLCPTFNFALYSITLHVGWRHAWLTTRCQQHFYTCCCQGCPWQYAPLQKLTKRARAGDIWVWHLSHKLQQMMTFYYRSNEQDLRATSHHTLLCIWGGILE